MDSGEDQASGFHAWGNKTGQIDGDQLSDWGQDD